MKKTLELIPNYNDHNFIPKFEIGVEYPPRILMFKQTTNYIYTLNDKSMHKLNVGTDGDMIIAKDEKGRYYRVYEGIQNAMFLLISGISKKSHP